MAKRDYYEVLGVSRTATKDEIRKAHRKLVLKHHPDRNKGDKKSEDKFKEVQEAYDIVGDEEKRKNYDQFGHAGVGADFGAGRGGDPGEAFRRAQAAGRGGNRWQASPNVSVEDFDFNEQGGFGDVFEQLFGRGGAGAARGGGRTRSRPQAPPSDLEHPVTLTFEQAAQGTTLPLQIQRDGHTESIEIKIPPGVKEGSRVRIKGKGQQSNGESGDLYIITRVTPHAYFRREGLDIYVDLPISVYEALTGARIAAPTLDGTVTLTIPPGTASHAKMRIKGKGIKRGDEQGDQFVVTRIILPKHLDDEDKKMIEELAKKHPINARENVPWSK